MNQTLRPSSALGAMLSRLARRAVDLVIPPRKHARPTTLSCFRGGLPLVGSLQTLRESMAPMAPISILCALVSFSFVSPAVADWPLFRGNALQNGVVDAKLPDKLEVRWKFQTKDAVEAAVAVVNGTVYAGSFDEHLYAIDLAKGTEKWKTKLGPIKAAPSFHDGRIYVGDEEGMFHCVDARDGKKLWSFETNGEITSSANFADGKIIFGSHDSTLYCLDKDGKVVWKFKTEGPVNGSPAIVGNLTFVAGCDSALHVLDVKSGKELKAIDLGGQAGATAAIRDQQLFVGTMANQFQAVDLKKAEIFWTYEPERSQPFYGSAAVTDKFIVVGGRDRLVHGLDRAKGKLLWTHPTKGRVDSSPVVVGGRVYVGSLDGHLYILELAKGTELQKLQLGRGILASPAVSGNCVVIGTTDGFVYCLGAKP
jgi:outer membrane protein assembly factor BamB